MTITHFDPFATSSSLPEPEEDPERITGGRYRLPDLTIGPNGELITGDGPRKDGWQRVTTLVKCIADSLRLDLWHQCKIIVGLVLRQDLFDLACATDLNDRKAIQAIANKALAAAGADIGANLGTAFHGFTEAQDVGAIVRARRKWHGKLSNYRGGLEAHALQVVPEYVERRVVVLRYGLAGTLDRILWDLAAQCYRIGDLKSQKTFWTWIEIAAQCAAYQMADAMWCRPKLCYVEMPKVADDLAVVAWMPVNHPDFVETGREADRDGVDFFNVDLSKGREILEVCRKVDAIRSEGRSVAQTIGTLRPMPAMTPVERYAARLDAVGSPGEGSVLWAEITTAGLHEVPELQELATEVAQRFLSEVS